MVISKQKQDDSVTTRNEQGWKNERSMAPSKPTGILQL